MFSSDRSLDSSERRGSTSSLMASLKTSLSSMWVTASKGVGRLFLIWRGVCMGSLEMGLVAAISKVAMGICHWLMPSPLSSQMA